MGKAFREWRNAFSDAVPACRVRLSAVQSIFFPREEPSHSGTVHPAWVPTAGSPRVTACPRSGWPVSVSCQSSGGFLSVSQETPPLIGSLVDPLLGGVGRVYRLCLDGLLGLGTLGTESACVSQGQCLHDLTQQVGSHPLNVAFFVSLSLGSLSLLGTRPPAAHYMR